MAQGVIGNLRVVISADSARFTKGMSDVQRQAKRAVTRLKAIAAVGVAAGAALTAIATRSGAAIDAQAKLAQSLSTTTGSLQVMERAGELAGVSMQGVEQATKDLTRRLSQAAEGTGPAADTLKALGLSAQELMKMPLDERVTAINAAINEFVPAANRAAVAGRLFGEEGSIAAMRLQPEVIRQASDEIDRMGLRISEVDAKKIELANDQLSGLGQVAKVAGQQIALAVLPAMGRLAEAMSRAFEAGKPLRASFEFLAENIDRLATYATTAAVVFAGKLVWGLASARIGTLSLTAAFTGLKAAIITNPIGLAIIAVSELALQFGRTRAAAVEYRAAVDGLASSQSDLSRATDEYLKSRTAATAEMMRMAAQAARDATASALEAAKAELEAAKFYTNFFGASLWETERMATATQSIANLEGALISAEARLSAAQASAGQFSKGLSDAAGAAGGLGGKLSDLSSSTRSAIPPAAELIAKYGDLGETVKRAMEAQNALADAATQADISGVVAQAKTLAEQLGLGADKAAFFRQDLEALSSTDPFGEQARELQRMAAYLLDVNGSVSQMSEQTRQVYGNLNAAAIMAADLAGGAQRSHAWVDAVSGAASSAFRNLAAAGGGARNLAAGLLTAYNASRNLLGSLNSVARTLGQVGSGLTRMAGAIIPPIAGLETAARRAGGTIGNMLGSIAETAGLSQFARHLGNAGKAMTGMMVETTATAAAADIAAASLNGKTGGSGSGGGLGGAAKAAAEKLTEAEEAAKELAESFKGKVVSAIDGVSSAFGDFVVGGFRDFKGFVSNVLNSFKRMLSEMIAMAAKNRIMIGLGLAAPAAGGIAGAAQQALGGGGGVGGMLSGFLGKALGSWGGGSGILGGMGSVISPLFNGGGLSGAISGLGSALGGGLTSAIGGLIPVVGVAAAAFSLFKTKTKELNRGIEVSIKGTDAWTWQFKKMQKTRFWGLSKKKSTEWERASAQIADPIKKAYLDIRRSTEGMAKSIGASTRALDGYRKTITLDTKGMSPEEAQRALLEKMQGVSDDLASRVIGRRFARDGETATETLQAMAVSLGAINDAFRGLGLRAMRGGVVSANAARNIIEQVGGVQAFQQAADHYFGAFYSLPEQAKMIGQKLRAEMRAVGVAGSISTTKQFRAMVDRLNRQGKNAAAASLIALSPMFSQWKQLTEQVAANSGAELKAAQEAQKQRADLIAQQREGLMRRLYELLGNTVALRRMDLKALDSANHAYQRRIWQLEDEKKWLGQVGEVADLLKSPLRLDADRYSTRYEAAIAAARERDREIQKQAGEAQVTELRLIRAAIKRIETEQREAGLYKEAG